MSFVPVPPHCPAPHRNRPSRSGRILAAEGQGPSSPVFGGAQQPQRIESTCGKCASEATGPATPKEAARPSSLLGRYLLDDSDKGLLGKGTFAVVQRGEDLVTGALVAVKSSKAASTHPEAALASLQRQVTVLKQLSAPFDSSAEHPRLLAEGPDGLFVRLLDYSKDTFGQAGPSEDGSLYVVTELAQCSLKDYLREKRSCQSALSLQTVQELTCSILSAVAGLHAKGFVHLDLKPENMMFFRDGKLKLIDVDGCHEVGSKITTKARSAIFSPCYCAPEWAAFVLAGANNELELNPTLDAWSLGLMLCELVTFQVRMVPAYKQCTQKAGSSREGQLQYMQWLAGLLDPPIPSSVETFDVQLAGLICSLLACDPAKRSTPMECLSSSFLQSTDDHRFKPQA